VKWTAAQRAERDRQAQQQKENNIFLNSPAMSLRALKKQVRQAAAEGGGWSRPGHGGHLRDDWSPGTGITFPDSWWC